MDYPTYSIYYIPIETEEKFYNRGGENYNAFLEWVDDDTEEILKEFANSSIEDFSEFCLFKWINEKFEV